MSDAYSMDVIRLAADIPNLGRLEGAQASVRKVSRICGSELTLDLSLDPDGRVAALGLDLQACALGQASASVFARDVIGASRAEIEAGRDALKAMLREGAPPPAGRFAGLAALQPAAGYRQRHGSILLAFEAGAEAAALAEAGMDRSERAGP